MENGEQIKSGPADSAIARRTVRLPPWLITYSDLITLLLTFFILLLSMADLDPKRFNEASNSLKGALGLKPDLTDNRVIVPVFPSTPAIKETSPKNESLSSVLENLRNELDSAFGVEAGLQTIQPDAFTLVVRLEETLLFSQNSDTLLPAAALILEKIGRSVKPYPIDVRIEGHTDAVEETIDDAANSWELSTSRAVSVLRHFVKQRMIPIERLSAVGYGAGRPVVKNSDEANRSLNRRVDILLSAQFASGTAPAKKPAPRFPL